MSEEDVRAPPAPVVVSQAACAAPASVARRISSAELLGSRRELTIEHNGEIYSLRVTSKGKLILTK